MLAALMLLLSLLLRLLAMTALLVSREQAVATILVASLLLLLLLVRGYSMSHRYTTARQSQEWSRDTATRGEGNAGWTGFTGKKATERGAPTSWGPQREGLVRTLSGHNEKPSRTLEHTSIVPTHHQKLQTVFVLRHVMRVPCLQRALCRTAQGCNFVQPADSARVQDGMRV